MVERRRVYGGEEEGPTCACHGSAGLSCVLTGCVWVLPDLCSWEEAYTSTLLPPSAAFKLENKNDTEKCRPYPKLKCAGCGKHQAATARGVGDCKCKMRPILVLLLHSLRANAFL